MAMFLFHMDDNTHLIAEVSEDQGKFPDPLRLVLSVAGVVRYWGTTRGRGQLCLEGPTSTTKTDTEPPGQTINWLHVRRQIPVTAQARAKWLKVLSLKE